MGIMVKAVHVLPSPGGWSVKSEDTNEEFDTKAEAEEVGRDIAKKKCVEFVLHDEDGRVRERDGYEHGDISE